MKRTTKILYTTAIAVMIAAASPVMAQTGTGSTGTGPGSTNTGPSGTGSSTTSPAGGTIGGSTGSNATGRSTGNATTANDAASSTMNVPGWETENTYWRSHYSSRPYYNKSTNYSAMEPAYRFGVQQYNKNNGKRYEDLDQTQLRADWEKMRGTSTLSWDQAQDAARDSYNRMYENRSKSGKSGSSGTSGTSTRNR